MLLHSVKGVHTGQLASFQDSTSRLLCKHLHGDQYDVVVYLGGLAFGPLLFPWVSLHTAAGRMSLLVWHAGLLAGCHLLTSNEATRLRGN
jgi:hypothetical protein